MKELPPQVALAKLRGDTYALKLMGQRGGRISQRRRDVQKAMEAFYKERAALELYRKAREANEHLVPADDTPAGQVFFNSDE